MQGLQNIVVAVTNLTSLCASVLLACEQAPRIELEPAAESLPV